MLERTVGNWLLGNEGRGVASLPQAEGVFLYETPGPLALRKLTRVLRKTNTPTKLDFNSIEMKVMCHKVHRFKKCTIGDAHL